MTVAHLSDDQMKTLGARLVTELEFPHEQDSTAFDPKLRRVHPLGIGAKGYFLASPVARRFCRAQHFARDLSQGHVQPESPDGMDEDRWPGTRVTVRYSNGSGCAHRHDGWTDVRGMAVRFHFGADAYTDLIAMTLQEFFTRDAPQFEDFAKVARPAPYRREAAWRKFWDMIRLIPPRRNPFPGETLSPDDGAIAYATRHAFSRQAVFDAAAIGAPENYVRAAYHAVHTFRVTGGDGVVRRVRFSWQPIDGVRRINPAENPEDAKLQEENYLNARLAERLGKGPARFSLMMQIGENGDAFDDPSRAWPPHRQRVNMGTLSLMGMIPEDRQMEDCELLRFNPWHLTDGIEATEDAVMAIRLYAYEFSARRRYEARGLTPCPFSWERDA